MQRQLIRRHDAIRREAISTKHGFNPTELVFAPHTACNLACSHCAVTTTPKKLSIRAARSFLRSISRTNVKRVSFSGGEPFLYPQFLHALSRTAVSRGFIFGRITTNACWFRSRAQVDSALKKLYNTGYDGDIAISLDAFHQQSISKVAMFIQSATKIFRRPDMIWLICVKGARDTQTKAMVAALARKLALKETRDVLRSDSLIIRINTIELAPIGRAASIGRQWADARWFTEDYCRGPGNILYVMPDGSIKPCCGYANEHAALTIGRVACRASKRAVLQANPLVDAIFTRGLHSIRKSLEAEGVTFPGRTGNHCFFCNHILTAVSRETLAKALRHDP